MAVKFIGFFNLIMSISKTVFFLGTKHLELPDGKVQLADFYC